MRIPFIAGNWKMNKSVQEAVFFVKELRSAIKDVTDVEIVVAPPFAAVHAVAEAARNTNIGVAAQNLYWEVSGAFTGEVSGPMIKEAGAEYVIVGHSERRQLFGESDATVNKKVLAAITSGLTPIVCVGETLEQRDKGNVEKILSIQLRGSLKDLDEKQLQETVIAYEPVWAIGTGRNATPQQAQEAHAFIRHTLGEMSDETTADRIRIQYGGSVKPENAHDLMTQADIDGALVGGASLDPRSFAQIVKAARDK